MEKLYEGKSKICYSTKNENELKIFFKNDVTAFNSLKKASYESKGLLTAKISNIIFKYLEKNGVKTHTIKVLDEQNVLVKKLKMFPLEIIIRNVAAGSIVKRLGIEQGTAFDKPIFEICYKNDTYGDPLINDDHCVVLNLATVKQLEEIKKVTLKINQLLIELFKQINIKVVDFKIELGLDKDNNICLGDEISPDTCRFWDQNNRKLDKDCFREDLDDITAIYLIILEKLESLNI
ncbi:phosphoribosylaminoimidazolesuccinocarboxamide synthase [Spiroplasma tabanidicola]|uniref:Phosphoribosylaminoimidazole-succinocarboxamide synthase n=1 Tax=Spiroplasma tabanidicola TaxID=324079 RepID=A0A6I6CBD8_9MOLU|nr:phosphoribosylaminoimidazolesuccinocarboxamide synthase [Spiroplasma tabanidicola]QGS52265.1 phosphoribosylaminoimidazole-succinocarboxamide synthase [Spiroplasma tabanidicola]